MKSTSYELHHGLLIITVLMGKKLNTSTSHNRVTHRWILRVAFKVIIELGIEKNTELCS